MTEDSFVQVHNLSTKTRQCWRHCVIYLKFLMRLWILWLYCIVVQSVDYF